MSRATSVGSALAAGLLLAGCTAPAGDHPHGPPRVTVTATVSAAARPAAAQPAAPVTSYDAQPWDDQPWDDQLDFGLLVGVRAESGSTVLVVDRAQFLAGQAALHYAKAHGIQPLNDYVIVNSNTRLREFRLLPGAALFGMAALTADPNVGSPGHPQRLTPSTLSARAAAWFASGDPSVSNRQKGILVWLRHAGGADGPVTYLGEQWVP